MKTRLGMHRSVTAICASALIIAAIFIAGSRPAIASQKTQAGKSSDVHEEMDRAQKAAAVLTDLMKVPDQGIPNELMERAKAVAVIPHVVKGALGIGGQFGKGLVAQRLEGGKWSAPAFIEIGGGSF